MTLQEVFGAAGAVAPGQECARAVLAFAYGLLLVRLAGRRVFGKWSALDTVVSIMVGSNLSRLVTGGAPLAGTLLATGRLFAPHWLVSHAAARSKWVSGLVEGRAAILVRDGRTDEDVRRRWAVSGVDLDEALHQSGRRDAGGVSLGILEPSGRISLLGAEPAERAGVRPRPIPAAPG